MSGIEKHPQQAIDTPHDAMTTSGNKVEEYGKTHVDYAEDLERDSTAKSRDPTNMERVEVTEEDVRTLCKNQLLSWNERLGTSTWEGVLS